MSPELGALARAVSAHRPRWLPLRRWMRQAAVAAVLRDGDAGPELLFIERERRRGDPWSGHMAFPGGTLEPADGSALSAARREAREEVGLDLARSGRVLGALSPVLATTHDRRRPMVITPFVFAVRPQVDLVLEPREVVEALWVPLSHFVPAHRTVVVRPVLGVSWRWPAYRIGQRILWGLTLQMVDELVRLGSPDRGRRGV